MAGSAVTQTYNSFSGVDMIVTFGNATVGEVQGVSYTVTREKAPLYTMGSANPRSFSRGKRGIAGSLIFLVFDRSALLDVSRQDSTGESDVILKKDSLTRAQMGSRARSEQGNLFDATNGTTVGTLATDGKAVRDFLGLESAKPSYHDQLPPFDVTISAANEYGHVCRMVVKNVEIMNAGSGMSIDDITTDESCTFVATEVIPWHAQKNVRSNIQRDMTNVQTT
ncbi:hypothetical protein N8457_00395 [bacterium]|nr:hypothetical protein [bacterium]